MPRRRLLIGWSLVVDAIIIGALVTYVGEPRFDLRLVHSAIQLRDGWTLSVMDVVSDYGYGTWLVPASLLVALVLALAGHHARALAVAVTTGLAITVTRLLKETFERTRPADPHELVAGFSMPSGHATAAAAFATSIILVLPRGGRWLVVAALLVALALLDGLSRVVLGAHYPTDVVAGFCAGTGVALIVGALVARWRPEPPVEPAATR